MIYDREVCMLSEGLRFKLGLAIAGLLAVVVGSVAAIVIVLVSKNNGDSLNTPTPAETTVVPSPTSTLTPEEVAFLSAIRTRLAFRDDSDTKLLQVGQAVCTAFDTGSPFSPVAQTVVASGVTEYDAGWLIGSSVHALCPEHISKLPGEE